MYLAVRIDLWSRRVSGYATSNRIDRNLVLDALTVARALRGSAQRLVRHTERGSQHASADYEAALRAAGFACSMSRKGNCWDNAPSESFYATTKTKCLHRHNFRTRAPAHATTAQFICWYNAQHHYLMFGQWPPTSFKADPLNQYMVV